MEVDVDGTRIQVQVRREGAEWWAVVDGRGVRVDAQRTGLRLSVLIAERQDSGRGSQAHAAREGAFASHDVAIEPYGPGRVLVHLGGHAMTVVRPQPMRARRRGGDAGRVNGDAWGQVTTPISGRVVKVLVEPGDAVKARQPLVVVEAMKMENELRAPSDGTVVRVLAREGALVDARAVLVVLE